MNELGNDFFGQELRKNLSVPVGLIQSSIGGTPAESWTSREALEADPVLGAGDLAVAGIGTGSSPGLLAVTDLLVLLDREAHPPCGSDRADRLARRLFHRDAGLQPTPVRRQLLVQLVKCGDARSDPVAAGVRVSIELV